MKNFNPKRETARPKIPRYLMYEVGGLTQVSFELRSLCGLLAQGMWVLSGHVCRNLAGAGQASTSFLLQERAVHGTPEARSAE